MEYIPEKTNVNIREKIFEGASEQPVDLEMCLPDYCPDVERILKCRICPSVTSKSLTGGSLDVEGTVTVHLYYLDSKKKAVRYCEHGVPFSCTFNVKNADDDCVCSIKLRSEYLKCRAVSPRKLDIHGAFSVIAAVYKSSPTSYVTSIGSGDSPDSRHQWQGSRSDPFSGGENTSPQRNSKAECIQQRLHTEKVSDLKGCAGQQFSVSEVLDIGSGKGTPETILRSELHVLTDDCRAIEDKLMLKGEVILKILYITDIESGSQDTMTFSVPLSQIIDVQGINENTVNDVRVDVMSYEVSLRSEFDEGSTLVTLDARLSASVFAYEQKELTVIDDAYSTLYDIEPVCKAESFYDLSDVFRMTNSVVSTISAQDNGISKVIDIWCDSLSSISDGLNVKGKMNCCMLALDRDGQPFCAEKSVDITFSPESGDTVSADRASRKRFNVDHSITVPNISFRITDDTSVEIKAEVRLYACVYSSSSCKCITDITADENKPRERDTTAAMTIYYADSGEQLWDIARKYCTSVECLREENDLPDDTLEYGTMIMIG